MGDDRAYSSSSFFEANVKKVVYSIPPALFYVGSHILTHAVCLRCKDTGRETIVQVSHGRFSSKMNEVRAALSCLDPLMHAAGQLDLVKVQHTIVTVCMHACMHARTRV